MIQQPQLFSLRKRIRPRDDEDSKAKFSFIHYELHQISDYYRHHKEGILAFAAIYILWFLAMTWMIWLPLFLFVLPTVFLPTFYLFNYTSFLNPFIKIAGVSFFELKNRFYRKRLYDDKRHQLNCLNIGYAD